MTPPNAMRPTTVVAFPLEAGAMPLVTGPSKEILNDLGCDDVSDPVMSSFLTLDGIDLLHTT